MDRNLENINMMITSSTINYFTNFPLALPEQTEQDFYIETNSSKKRNILSTTLVSLTNAFNIKRACCMYNTEFNKDSFIEVPIRLYIDSTVDNYSTLATKFVMLDQYGYPAPLLDNNNKIIFDKIGRIVHSTTLSNIEEYNVRINKEVCKNIDNLTYNGTAEYKKSDNLIESQKCDNFYRSFCKQLSSYNPYNPLINRKGIEGYSNECSCILSDKIEGIGEPYKISSLDPICTSAGTYIPKDIIETHDCYPSILPENYKRFGVDFSINNLGNITNALSRLSTIKYTELEKMNIANRNQDLLPALYTIFTPLDYTDIFTGVFTKGFDRLSISKNIKDVLNRYRNDDPRKKIGFYFNRSNEQELVHERFIRRIFKSEIFGNDIVIGFETYVAIIIYILQNNPNMSDLVLGQYRIDNNDPIISGTFTPPEPSERPEFKCVKNIYFGPPLPDTINYIKLSNFIDDYLIVLREVFNFNNVIIQDYRNLMNNFVKGLPKNINYVNVNDIPNVKREKIFLDLFFSIGIPIENISDYNLKNIKKNITDIYLNPNGAERTKLKLSLNNIERNLNRNVLTLYGDLYKIKRECILDIEKKINSINNNSIVRRIFENENSRVFFKVVIESGNRYDLLKFFVDEFGSNYSLLDIENILALFSEEIGMSKNDIKKFIERIKIYRKETTIFNTIKNIINLSPKELFMYFLGLRIFTDNRRTSDKHSLLYRFYLKYRSYFKPKEYIEIENTLTIQKISTRVRNIERQLSNITKYGRNNINGLIYNDSNDTNYIYNLYIQDTGINTEELKYNRNLLKNIYDSKNKNSMITLIEYMYENYPYNDNYYDLFNNPYKSTEYNALLKNDLSNFLTMSLIIIILKAKDNNIIFEFKDIETVLYVYGYFNNINNNDIRTILDIIKPVFSTKDLQYKYLFNYNKVEFINYRKFTRKHNNVVSPWNNIETIHTDRNLAIGFNTNGRDYNINFNNNIISSPLTTDFIINYDELYGPISNTYNIYRQYNTESLNVNVIKNSNDVKDGVKSIIDNILNTEILYSDESPILRYKMVSAESNLPIKLVISNLGFLTPTIISNNVRFSFPISGSGSGWRVVNSVIRDFSIDKSTIDSKYEDITENIHSFYRNNFMVIPNETTVDNIIRNIYVEAFKTLTTNNPYFNDMNTMISNFYNKIEDNKHGKEGLLLGDIFKYANINTVVNWFINTYFNPNITNRLTAFRFMTNNINMYGIPSTNPVITRMFNITFNNNEISNTPQKLRSTTVIGTTATNRKKYLICKLIYSRIPSSDLTSIFNIGTRYLNWNIPNVIKLVRHIELARSYENYISNIFFNKFTRYNDIMKTDVELPFFNLNRPDFSLGFTFNDSETIHLQEEITSIEPFININNNVIIEDFIVGKIVRKVTNPVKKFTKNVGNDIVKKVINPVGRGVTNAANKISDGVTSATDKVKTELEKTFESIINTLKNDIFGRIGTEITSLFDKIVNEVKTPLESLFNTLKNDLGDIIVQPIVNIATGIASSISRETNKIFNGVVESVSGVYSDVSSTITDKFDSVTGTIKDTFNDIIDKIDFESFFRTIKSFFTDKIGDIFNSLSDIFGDLLETLTEIFAKVIDKVVPILTSIFEKVVEIFIDVLENVMGRLISIFEGIFTMLFPVIQLIFWQVVNTFIIPGLMKLYNFLRQLWDKLDIVGRVRKILEDWVCPRLRWIHPEFCEKIFAGDFITLLWDINVSLYNSIIRPIWNRYIMPAFWKVYDWAKEYIYDNIIWLWNEYGMPAVNWLYNTAKHYTCVATKFVAPLVYTEYKELSCDQIYDKIITKFKWSGIVVGSSIIGSIVMLLTMSTLFGSFVLSIFN